ncbi:hypothetical protein [Mycobacteroides chelonae]|nr:hypothetical protein [Mycobacteroides chelonae]
MTDEWWGLGLQDLAADQMYDDYYDGMNALELAAQRGMERIEDV